MRRISVYISMLLVFTVVFFGFLGINPDSRNIEKGERISRLDEIEISGVIYEVSYVSDDYYKIAVRSKAVGKILLGIKGKAETLIYDLPGRKIKASVNLQRPEKASNPGEFDYDRYLRTEGIYLIGDCQKNQIDISNVDNSFIHGYLPNKISNFKNSFYEIVGEEGGEAAAGLISGMLFGEKERLSDESYESFRQNGTAHILSVSGLHVGVLYGFINMIAGKRRRSTLTLIITVGLLIICTVLASFSVSVLRAVFMIVLHLISERIHCRYDLISAAFFTAAVFIIINPMTVYSTGFILSFSSVISLSVIGNGMNRIVKCNHPVFRIFSPIVSIQLGMAPINAYLFNCFSFASFISNIPVIFLSSIIIPLGIVTLIFYSLGGVFLPATELLCSCCGFMGDMMFFFNDFTGAYGRMCFNIATPSIVLTVSYYAILFLIFSEYSFLNPLSRKKAVIILAVAVLILPAIKIEEILKPDIVFLNIGQGDCIHIRTNSGKNYLIDGGGSSFSDYDIGEKVIYKYLLKSGVDHLDGVFISHMDDDHYKGTASLNELMDTGRVYLYSGYQESEEIISEKLNKASDDISYLSAGDVLYLDEGITMEIIFPEYGKNIDISSGDTELNELSLVMLLNYNGKKVLFTGDIGEAEKELFGDFSCDILKVPHHGSKYSSSEELVEGAKPEAAVIQVGKNNFGHPAESVIERYMKKGIILFRNDEDGAVMVNINSDGFEISGYKSGAKNEF